MVPATEADQAYAEEVADKLADYVWNKRHEFHYTGTTAKPEDALAMALSFEGKPFVITDSGDNTTSGATGWNTFILRQALATKSDKRILFASICDPKTCDLLDGLDLGTKTEIELGAVSYTHLMMNSSAGFAIRQTPGNYPDSLISSLKSMNAITSARNV